MPLESAYKISLCQTDRDWWNTPSIRAITSGLWLRTAESTSP